MEGIPVPRPIPEPLGDTVLIAQEKPKTYVEQLGLKHVVVPERWAAGPTDPPKWGEIKAKGAGCKVEEVKVGDRVMWGKWSGAKVGYPGQDLLVVREADLLAVQR